MRFGLQWRASVLVAAMACGVDGAEGQNKAEIDAYLRRSLENSAASVRASQERAAAQTVAALAEEFRRTGQIGSLQQCAQLAGPDDALRIFSPLLAHTNAEVRACALAGLSRHGPRSAPALSAILTCLSDGPPFVTSRAALALGAIGPQAAPAVELLVQLLDSPAASLKNRQAAAEALACIGPAAAAALPSLERLITNTNAALAHAAFNALCSIQHEPPLERAELMAQGVVAFRERMACRAFEALSAGVLPSDAASQLIENLLRPAMPPALRIAAARSSTRLQLENARIVTALLASASDPIVVVGEESAAALAGLPARDPTLVPVLAEACGFPQARPAQAAAELLARFGPRASSAWPALVASLPLRRGLENYDCLGATLRALRSMGPAAAGAGPGLAAFLREESPLFQSLPSYAAMALRRYLLVTLADIGVPSQALPAIADGLANASQAEDIAAAARAAGRLPTGHERIVPLLIQVLQHRNLDVAVDVDSWGVGVMQLDGPHTSAFLEAIRSLRGLGPVAKPALDILRQRAHDPPGASPLAFPYQAEAAELAKTLAHSP